MTDLQQRSVTQARKAIEAMKALPEDSGPAAFERRLDTGDNSPLERLLARLYREAYSSTPPQTGGDPTPAAEGAAATDDTDAGLEIDDADLADVLRTRVVELEQTIADLQREAAVYVAATRAVHQAQRQYEATVMANAERGGR